MTTELSAMDVYLFAEGTHRRVYDKLGGRLAGDAGATFRVWAPNARSVSVIGDFNGWDPRANVLCGDESGIWQGCVGQARRGDLYKFHVESNVDGYVVDKCDPYALYSECPPATASVLWDLYHEWGDGDWLAERRQRDPLNQPMSIYEVHLGSWRRDAEGRSLTYRLLAHELAEYAVDMGYTHVQLMPVMEHPFYGSWGYQVTGYFAPSARFGIPQDFMYLVDHLHQAGIGVLLDWVPAHFPADQHALARFDGTHLYEHADPRLGYHPDWHTCIFNYQRHEVRAFLISSALFWLDRYHIDGLRVDAVASMLYLDYGRSAGEWLPNADGGRENYAAVEFLRTLNQAVREFDPSVQVIAEESTAWPGVSRPATEGGLGFTMKWNMGWMHDTLRYFAEDPIHRSHHHDEITFSMVYAFHENFVLPLSHDEVVYGKGSLLNKLPGDDWQRFAQLRLLLGYACCHPGKQLMFMGGEFGQRREWNHDAGLDWHLLTDPAHAGVAAWVRDLNAFYRRRPALWQLDFDPAGFQWVVADDRQNSVLCFLRHGTQPADALLVICNFTPVPRANYRVGVPGGGRWYVHLNSDDPGYGGSGAVSEAGHAASPLPSHGHHHSLNLTLPPLGMLVLSRQGLMAVTS